MEDQLHVQQRIAFEKYYKLEIESKLIERENSPLSNFQTRMSDLDFDIPEISEINFKKSYKKVQRMHKRRNNMNEQGTTPVVQSQNTREHISSAPTETPHSIQAAADNVNAHQIRREIPCSQSREGIPTSHDDFDDQSLEKANSLGMGSQDHSESLRSYDFENPNSGSFNQGHGIFHESMSQSLIEFEPTSNFLRRSYEQSNLNIEHDSDISALMNSLAI